MTTKLATRQGRHVRVAAPEPSLPRSVRVTMAVAITFIPLLRPAGPGNTGLTDVGIIAAVLAVGIWMRRTRRAVQLPYLLGMGLMIVAGVIATWRAMSGSSAMAILQDIFMLSWGATVAGVGLTGPNGLRFILRWFCRSGIAWAGVLVVSDQLHIAFIAGLTARDGARASLTFNDPNLAADYFVIVFFVTAASSAFRWAGTRLPALLLVLVAIAFTGSNGAVLGIVFGTGVAVVIGARRRHGMAVGVAVCMCLVAAGALLGPRVNLQSIAEGPLASVPLIHDSVGRTGESTGSRADLWTEEIALWSHRDLVGIGPTQTRWTLQETGAPYVKEAHTDYLATVVERGALGGLGLVVLACTLAAAATRVVGAGVIPAWPPTPWRDRSIPVPRPEFLVSALIAVAIAALFYEVLHFRQVWFLFGLIAACDPNRRLLADRSGRWAGGGER
jgi:hypothetical protein